MGIGLLEIVVLAVVAFVCLRPEDLPVLARRVGRLYQQVQALRLELDDYFRRVAGAAAEPGAEAHFSRAAPEHDVDTPTPTTPVDTASRHQ